MNVRFWYVCFYRSTFEDFWHCFPHCEAFGFTDDDSWVFIDAQRKRCKVRVLHKIEEVENAVAVRVAHADLILKVEKKRDHFLPPLLPLTCASFVGHIVGARAWTVPGLKKKLLRDDPEIIHEADHHAESVFQYLWRRAAAADPRRDARGAAAEPRDPGAAARGEERA